MENEGIMSLPEGQAMQNQGPTNQPIYVSSADTYDAALTALGASTNDPAQVEAALPVITKVMVEAPHPAVQLRVPLQVDARAAGNWDEAH